MKMKRLPAATDPSLLLLRNSAGWSAYADLPDMSPLAERLPELHEQLGRLRAQISGMPGRYLVKGRLLFADQRVRLEEWPSPRVPFAHLEDASPAINVILADQCVISPGPVWLFRLRGPGLAIEVRGKFARPGNEYICVGMTDSLIAPTKEWVTRENLAVGGATALRINVPDVLNVDDIQSLARIGLSTVSDVTVRPVGLVPGSWDGEGFGEWLAGDDVLLGIRSQREIQKGLVTVNGVTQMIEWDAESGETFLALKELELGSHEISVALIPSGGVDPLIRGSIVVSIRPPHSRPTTGTMREGIQILAAPAQPTLEEIWEGKAALDVLGPPETKATLEIALNGGDSGSVASVHRQITLPLTAKQWLSFAAQELQKGELGRFYDTAESCVITTTHVNMGTASLTCERQFRPLRWTITRDHGEAAARLINNTEDTSISVELFDFAEPTRAKYPSPSEQLYMAPPLGALIRARAGEALASIILPPDPNQMLRAHTKPVVPVHRPTAQEIQRLLSANRMWATAGLPGGAFALSQRRAVLRAITRSVVTLFAGQPWNNLEHRWASRHGLSLTDLQVGLGAAPYEQAIGTAVCRTLQSWCEMQSEARSQPLATIFWQFGGSAGIREVDPRLAECALRLASEPGTLLSWNEPERSTLLDTLLHTPVLVRAARFVVLAIDDLAPDASFTTTYGGWEWT